MTQERLEIQVLHRLTSGPRWPPQLLPRTITLAAMPRSRATPTDPPEPGAMLANDPGLDPVGQIPNVPPFTKLGDQDEQLGFGDVDVDRLRSISRAHRGRRDARFAIGQYSKDHAAQRSGAIIDPDQRLESPVAGLQPVSKQRLALRSQPPVKAVATELKAMAIDGPVNAQGPGCPEVAGIILGIDLPVGQIHHSITARIKPDQVANRNSNWLAEPRGRDHLSALEPGVGDPAARAVGERQIQVGRIVAGIADHSGIKADGNDSGPIDFHRPAVDLELDRSIIETKKSTRQAVPVGHPDDLGGPGLAGNSVPELVEPVGFGRGGQ